MIFLALLIYALSLVFLLYIVLSFFIFKGWKYPPYVPSFGKIKHTLLQETADILEKSHKSLVVADLGCGDGCLLAKLARKFPNHKFIGYEWNPFPFYLSKMRLKKYSNVTLIHADLMQEDLSDIDVVIFYWSSDIDFNRKLKKSLKKSAIVLSEIFELTNWKVYKKVISKLFGFKTPIFIYRVQDQKFSKQTEK